MKIRILKKSKDDLNVYTVKNIYISYEAVSYTHLFLIPTVHKYGGLSVKNAAPETCSCFLTRSSFYFSSQSLLIIKTP